MGFRTSSLWFPAIPLSCHPNYRALTFTLAGLSPAEHTSLSWSQPPHHLISGRDEARTKVPHATVRGLQGSKEDGTHLTSGVLQPHRRPVTHPPWNLVMFLSSQRVSSHLQSSAFRHQACLEIAPERNQQLACDRDDRNPPDAAFEFANTIAEPDTQGAVRLMSQPHPRELNHDSASLGIASLADTLITAHRAALKMRRRQTDIARQLFAIVK
jgi:hypothetical protein